jgi:hypothetical protein
VHKWAFAHPDADLLLEIVLEAEESAMCQCTPKQGYRLESGGDRLQYHKKPNHRIISSKEVKTFATLQGVRTPKTSVTT